MWIFLHEGKSCSLFYIIIKAAKRQANIQLNNAVVSSTNKYLIIARTFTKMVTRQLAEQLIFCMLSKSPSKNVDQRCHHTLRIHERERKIQEKVIDQVESIKLNIKAFTLSSSLIKMNSYLSIYY